MGDPAAPSPLPPHRPRGTRTGWQGDEILLHPAMPAQLPGGSGGPIGGTERPHPPEATTEGPRTRAQRRAAAPETAPVWPQASHRTAAALRALLAEGAPGRALQLRTSDGVCDAADPAVLTRLRGLHPQAEGPSLKPPLPEDRPDFAPSWATDQLLAMEAVVRYFPPGSAAGPSGLPPQHLLDCLDPADSAAKAVLLEAPLTLVTAISSGRLHPRLPVRGAPQPPKKKVWGSARPIAVSDSLRMLVAKWLLASAQGRNAAAALASLQTALAKESPCEVVAMGCRPRWTPCTGAHGGACRRWT